MNAEMGSGWDVSSDFPGAMEPPEVLTFGVSVEQLSSCNRQLLRLALKYLEPGMDEAEFRRYRVHLINSVLKGDLPLVEERVPEGMSEEQSVSKSPSRTAAGAENPLNWVQPYVQIPPWVWALSLFVVLFTVATWIYLTRI